MEIAAVLTFATVLIGFVAAGIPILYALLCGYAIFSGYALIKKYSPRQIARMSWAGIKMVKNILIVLALIGMLTAVWRAAGTIPTIVCYAARLTSPSLLLLLIFLLNCLVSFLMGTAFGTAATMGVISMSMARIAGLNAVLAGGAVISGLFFGDRCSPVSTSALLISELTETDLYGNIKLMFKTAAIPFALTAAIYGAAGVIAGTGNAAALDLRSLFEGSFALGWIATIPAAVLLVMALFRINIKLTMLGSIISALAICLLYQRMPIGGIPALLWGGYHAIDAELAAMIDGGGIYSMANVAAIVSISSLYAGIFEGTGMLDGIRAKLLELSRKTSPFFATLCAAAAAVIIGCNQSLAIMLTFQACTDTYTDRRKLAIDIENTTVVMAPLVPWSIACAVPLATISAPAAAILAACYVYILPLWQLAAQGRGERHRAAARCHGQG